MRGAREAQVARDNNGEVYAISLGADFCAEHEWGINRLYQIFQIDPELIGTDPVGIESRRVKFFPGPDMAKQIVMKDFKRKPRKRDPYSVGWTGTFLGLLNYMDYAEGVDPTKMREFLDHKVFIPPREREEGDEEYDMQPLTTAWADGDFAIFARKPDEVAFLKELHQAFENLDVAVWLGGGGVFRRPGLCFGIISKMPEEFIDMFRLTDEDRIALEKADAATGIKDRLKAAGEAAGDGSSWRKPFGYYALSPRWASMIHSTKDGVIETEYDVVYWLNPQDQDNVNFGWFTVEQLDQWIAGEGPIPGGRNARKSA